MLNNGILHNYLVTSTDFPEMSQSFW